jgi:hypothetical protein
MREFRHRFGSLSETLVMEIRRGTLLAGCKMNLVTADVKLDWQSGHTEETPGACTAGDPGRPLERR